MRFFNFIWSYKHVIEINVIVQFSSTESILFQLKLIKLLRRLNVFDTHVVDN